MSELGDGAPVIGHEDIGGGLHPLSQAMARAEQPGAMEVIWLRRNDRTCAIVSIAVVEAAGRWLDRRKGTWL